LINNNILNKYLYSPIIYILFIFTLIVGTLSLKYDNLFKSALHQNLQLVNPILNKKIEDFIEKNSGGIATSYQPMGFIHSLSERFFLVQCASKNQFLSGFALSEAKYYLVGDWCSEDVRKFMDKTTSQGKFNALFRVDGFTLYELADANLKILLSKNGVIGLNSRLEEFLNFPDSSPFNINKIYNIGSINKIKPGRFSLSFSGELPSTINNQKTEWIIVTIGGKALILSEITNGEDTSLKNEINISKSLSFMIDVPYSVLKKNTGAIRLFGVVNNQLYELFYDGPDIDYINLNSEIIIVAKDKKLILKNNKLDVRQLDL
jgi:hypothetical protein